MEVPIVFLPNRLKSTVNYSIKEKVNEVLAGFGQIAPEIADRITLQRLDCFTISTDSKEVIKDAYQWIYHSFLKENSPTQNNASWKNQV